MSARIRRRVKSAKHQSAHRRFFATVEQLEPRQMLNVDYTIGVTEGKIFQPMKACTLCDVIQWVGNAWQAASDWVGSFEGQAGDLDVAASSRSMGENSRFLPNYSTRELRPGVAAAKVTVPAATSWSTLEVETTFNTVTGSTKYFNTSGLSSLAEFQVSDLIDVAGLPAGRYPFHMDFVGNRVGGGADIFDYNGHILVTGPSDSLMSPGWRINGLDRLSFDGDGALWETAGGELYWFDEVGGNYTSPSGELTGAFLDEVSGEYIITDRWGNVTTFNSLGLVISKQDRHENVTTFVYDTIDDLVENDLIEINSFDGTSMTFVYDTSSPYLLESITDFDGRTVTLGYDAGILETLTFPDPGASGDPLVIGYGYNGDGLLDSVTEGLGAGALAYVTEYTFDPVSWALTSLQHPDGTVENYTAALPQTLGSPSTPAAVVLAADVAVTKTTVDGNGSADLTTSYYLGAFGRVKKIVDPLGNITQFTLDNYGRVTKRTDPDPDGGSALPAPETDYGYDGDHNLTSMELPDGTDLTWEDYHPTWNIAEKYTNELGLVTLYDVNDTTGNIDSIRQIIGLNDEESDEEDDIVTSFTYYALGTPGVDPPAGLVESMTDGLGRITLYEYNPRGNPTKITYAYGTADEAEVNIHYAGLSTVDYIDDELGRRTNFYYDALLRLTKTVLPPPDNTAPTIRPEYELLYDIHDRVITSIDALDRETYTTYDKRSHVTKVERPDHDGDTYLTTTEMTYTRMGLLTSSKDPLGRLTDYTYDNLGRQTFAELPEVADPTTAVNEIQIIDFDSGTEGTFKLNGNTKNGTIDLADTSDFQTVLDSIWGPRNTSVKVTATEATVTFLGAFAATNVAQMTISDIADTKGATPAVSTDKAGIAADMVNPVIETVFDNLGRPTKTIDALGNETNIAYANFGREVTITLPDPDGKGPLTSSVLYQKFDPAGNLIEDKDANGNTTYRTYDVLGRLITVTEPDPDAGGPLAAPVTLLEYDKAHNLITTTDAAGNVYGYQYNNRDWLIKTTSPDPDGDGPLTALVTENKHDAAGQLQSVTAPGNRKTNYGYDDLGRTTSITSMDPDGKGPQTAPVTKFAYDAAGQMIGMTDPLGNETLYIYDSLGNQIVVLQSDPDGDGIKDAPLTYREFDAAGQLLGESQGLAMKEIQRLYFGSAASPLSPLSGSYELSFDGEVTYSINATDSAYTVQSYLESLPNVGYGNILVSDAPHGFLFIFRGPFSNQDVPQISVYGSSILSSDGVYPTTSVTQSATSGVNEVQALDFGGATTGTLDVAGNSTSATVYSLDSYGLQSALDSIWGYGNTTVYQNGSTYEVTFASSFAGQDIAEMYVSSNSTDGSPSFSTLINGVAGLPEIVEIALVGEPTQGTWTFGVNGNYEDVSYGVSGSSLEYIANNTLGVSVSVSGGSGGPWTITGVPGVSLGTWYAQTTSWSDPLAKAIGVETSEVQPGVWDWWNTITYAYDNLGRISSVTQADPDGLGGENAPVTHYAYDLNSNLYSVTDALYHVSTYQYDALNRRSLITDALAGQTSFMYDAAGNLLSLTDPVGNETSWVYDTLHRVIEEKNELNLSRFFAYDVVGNLIEKQDRLDRFTVYGYDNLQRQTREQWWADDEYPIVGVTITTQGSGGGDEVQVVTLTNTTGGTFTLTFDGQTTVPLDWDATNTEVDTALEALSNIDTVTVSGSAGGPFTITFTGSLAQTDVDQLTASSQELTNADLLHTVAYTFNAAGELSEVSDSYATYEFLYDDLGRVTNYVQNIAGLNPEIEFASAYNAASRRTSLQAVVDSTNDFKNTYGYDNMLRMSTLVQQSPTSGNVVAPKRIEFAYNEISQYTRIDRYAHTGQAELVTSSHFNYDDANRLMKLVHSETTTAPTLGWGSEPLAGYKFVYDTASRIASIDSYLDGLTTYAHDDTNQLVGADHNTADDEAYEYDANGNRIMSGYVVNPNNQMYSDGVYVYTYDEEGNRETRTLISNNYVTVYTWDHRNRLTAITEKDDSNNILQITQNSYDAFGQWIRRSFDADGPGGDPAVDTFFVYESGQIVFQFDGNDAADLSHRYLWGEQVDQLFADESVTSLGSPGDVLWPLGDHLGTLRDLVSYNSGTDDASIANHREYDSYGILTNESNDAIDLLFGFTGRALDNSTNLQQNGYRWYEAANAVWTSEDPKGFGGRDANLARYVGNSSILWIDPFGLEGEAVAQTQPPTTIGITGDQMLAAIQASTGGDKLIELAKKNAGVDSIKIVVVPGKGTYASVDGKVGLVTIDPTALISPSANGRNTEALHSAAFEVHNLTHWDEFIKLNPKKMAQDDYVKKVEELEFKAVNEFLKFFDAQMKKWGTRCLFDPFRGLTFEDYLETEEAKEHMKDTRNDWDEANK